MKLLHFARSIAYSRSKFLDAAHLLYRRGIRAKRYLRVPASVGNNDGAFPRALFGSVGSGITELLKHAISVVGIHPFRAPLNFGDFGDYNYGVHENVIVESCCSRPSIDRYTDLTFRQGGKNPFAEWLHFEKPAIKCPMSGMVVTMAYGFRKPVLVCIPIAPTGKKSR